MSYPRIRLFGEYRNFVRLKICLISVRVCVIFSDLKSINSTFVGRVLKHDHVISISTEYDVTHFVYDKMISGPKA